MYNSRRLAAMKLHERVDKQGSINNKPAVTRAVVWLESINAILLLLPSSISLRHLHSRRYFLSHRDSLLFLDVTKRIIKPAVVDFVLTQALKKYPSGVNLLFVLCTQTDLRPSWALVLVGTVKKNKWTSFISAPSRTKIKLQTVYKITLQCNSTKLVQEQ